MVECGGLENRYILTGIRGSNPWLSAGKRSDESLIFFVLNVSDLGGSPEGMPSAESLALRWKRSDESLIFFVLKISDLGGSPEGMPLAESLALRWKRSDESLIFFVLNVSDLGGSPEGMPLAESLALRWKKIRWESDLFCFKDI